MTNARCPVCESPSTFAFRWTILCSVDCNYYQCGHCGLLHTEAPRWHHLAYSAPVSAIDTGMVQRNIGLSTRIAGFLYSSFPQDGRFLDAAGGTGLMTRLMRDLGFDYYWADPYSSNVLAQGFEADPAMQFSAVTAVEVLEHVTHPVEFTQELLATSGAGTIVFTTQLYQGAPPPPERWAYYAFETGQHISFFQRKTLEFIAKRLGKQLLSNGHIHAFTNLSMTPTRFRLVTGRTFWTLARLVAGTAMQPRTVHDSEILRAKAAEALVKRAARN